MPNNPDLKSSYFVIAPNVTPNINASVVSMLTSWIGDIKLDIIAFGVNYGSVRLAFRR